MAQYKVPQDVEADDKLLGPFTFRQFIYLIISAGLIALAVALFQVFPLLVLIPVPFILFFGALALPLKKDQPMETYFAALVSYYLKPRRRFWETGQPESTIRITAPKKVETTRKKDLSQDEASHRLSFLAEIVDSEGHAIKGNTGPIRDEVVAEASATPDMFESYSLTENLQSQQDEQHAEAVRKMKEAIESTEGLSSSAATIQKFNEPENPATTQQTPSPVVTPSPIVQPTPPSAPTEQSQSIAATQPQPSPAMVNLANDNQLSIATIAKEANRINQKPEDEVFISLH